MEKGTTINEVLSNKICHMYSVDKIGYEVIAKIVDIPRRQISKLLKSCGFTRTQSTGWEKEIEMSIIEEYKNSDGTNIPFLAKKYHVRRTRIWRLLKRYGVYIAKEQSFYRDYKINENVFDNLDKQCQESEDALWVLGWYFSDGCNNSDNNLIGLGLKKDDIEVLYKIQKVFNYEKFPKITNKNVAFLQINSKKLSQKLTELGCVKAKSNILRYPKILTQEWQHAAFLRGVFEGDGSVGLEGLSDGNVSICASGSLLFLKDVEEIIAKYLSLKTKIYYKEYPSKITENVIIHAGEIRANGHAFEKVKFLDWIYKNGTAKNYLERKFSRYLKYIGYAQGIKERFDLKNKE